VLNVVRGFHTTVLRTDLCVAHNLAADLRHQNLLAAGVIPKEFTLGARLRTGANKVRPRHTINPPQRRRIVIACHTDHHDATRSTSRLI
jgi:hypothetical protein